MVPRLYGPEAVVASVSRGSCAQTAISADGSAIGSGHSDRAGMAVRAEMGWLPLPGVSRWRQSRAAIEIGPAADPLLSRSGPSRACGERAEVSPRRQDSRSQ